MTGVAGAIGACSTSCPSVLGDPGTPTCRDAAGALGICSPHLRVPGDSGMNSCRDVAGAIGRSSYREAAGATGIRSPDISSQEVFGMSSLRGTSTVSGGSCLVDLILRIADVISIARLPALPWLVC